MKRTPIRRAPLAYVYADDFHCPKCASERFGLDRNGRVPKYATDYEGNPVGTIEQSDVWWDPDDEGYKALICGTCGKIIQELKVLDEWTLRRVRSN